MGTPIPPGHLSRAYMVPCSYTAVPWVHLKHKHAPECVPLLTAQAPVVAPVCDDDDDDAAGCRRHACCVLRVQTPPDPIQHTQSQEERHTYASADWSGLHMHALSLALSHTSFSTHKHTHTPRGFKRPSQDLDVLLLHRLNKRVCLHVFTFMLCHGSTQHPEPPPLGKIIQSCYSRD